VGAGNGKGLILATRLYKSRDKGNAKISISDVEIGTLMKVP